MTKAAKRKAAWVQSRRHITRKHKLKFLYGITPEQYEGMHENQSGLCAICGKPETYKHHKTNKTVRLSVDHSHKSSKIRGLLCRLHNRVLGLMEDSPELLEAAANYLRKYNES